MSQPRIHSLPESVWRLVSRYLDDSDLENLRAAAAPPVRPSASSDDSTTLSDRSPSPELAPPPGKN